MMSFKNNLIKVIISNFINAIMGVVSGFLIPAFLSIENYAMLKTFTLYCSFVGILHFGFIDGLYLLYGGKEEVEVNYNKLKSEHDHLIKIQILISVLVLIVGLLINSIIIMCISVCILPINLQTMYKFFYQAIGKFKAYSKLMIFTPAIILFLNLFNIYIIKLNSYIPFIASFLIGNMTIFIVLEYLFKSKKRYSSYCLSSKEIFDIYKIGGIVMIANFAYMLIFAIDRLYVKIFFDQLNFAYYSFAISIMALVNIMVQSLSMTLYPYIARSKNTQVVMLLKVYCLLIGSFIAGGIFVLNIIIKLYLNKYTPALKILSILFWGYPALITISTLYVNLYKTNNKGRFYLRSVLQVLFISIIMNTLGLLIYKDSISIAFATTISLYIWYYYSSTHFEGAKFERKEMVFLILFSSLYYFALHISSVYISMVFYYIIIAILIYMFFKKQVKLLIRDLLR